MASQRQALPNALRPDVAPERNQCAVVYSKDGIVGEVINKQMDFYDGMQLAKWINEQLLGSALLAVVIPIPKLSRMELLGQQDKKATKAKAKARKAVAR